jgi:hypothetical protein
VPALERSEVALLFQVKTTDSPDAVLKLTGAGMIHGIPLTEVQAPPPAMGAAPSPDAGPVPPADAPVPAPPQPPKDSVGVRRPTK